jgi:hypothetical protein
MSFNGSGTFLINTAGQPVVSGTVISSTAFNALTADLATGLSTAITKDGQTTVTANIPMSTYKFTGLGVGSAATDSANLSQVQSTVTKLLNSVSGADTITATASPTLAAYAAGQMFYFVAAGDNTTSVTLNIDALGAKAVTRDGSVALAAADIKSGEVIVVVYDGTRFQVVSQLNSAGDARFANVSIASSLYVGGVSTFVGNAGFSANVSIASALSVGGVAAITGATTIGGNLTLSGGTANGVAFLNASKVVTAGTGLVFDGTNLGIGMTLSAWRSGARALQLGPAGYVSLFEQANGAANLAFAAYESAANTFAYRTTGDAPTLYQQLSGIHTWSNAVAGTANATFSFTERMRLDTSGNLGIGTSSPAVRVHAYSGTAMAQMTVDGVGAIKTGINFANGGTIYGQIYFDNNSPYDMTVFQQYTTGSLRFGTNNTERARITSGGEFLVGTTTAAGYLFRVYDGISQFTQATSATDCADFWNRATSGDNKFVAFYTETSATSRGSITYNRAGGLVSYNTTSDYRAKDILGPIQNSGATIDALKVYEGQMKGATQSRPMLVAHEAQEHAPYTVTGEKDAVNEDGTPNYQQMDVSALVPLLLAEVQSLRKRVAELEAK